MEIKKMEDLTNKAKEVITNIMGKQVIGVIGATEDKGKWTIAVQALEKEAVPPSQSLTGIYDVVVSEKGNIISYKQTELRRLGDTKASLEEE